MIMLVGAFIVITAGYFTVAGIIEQQARLDNQMMEWAAAYHLTAEQADRIRQIEARFHGNGNPFTSRGAGIPAENDAHHLEISRVMNPEDGAHFLHSLTLNEGRH